MARPLVRKLDDIFAEVGLDRLDAVDSRKGLSAISSAIMDLLLVTVLAPAAWQSERMTARASSGVSHQCTAPPLAVTCAS